MIEEKLARSCPWCGPYAEIEIAEFMHLEHYVMHYCCCKQCGAKGPDAVTKEGALEKWNRRFGDSGALKIPSRER